LFVLGRDEDVVASKRGWNLVPRAGGEQSRHRRYDATL
jgi:hypothetical protein